MNLANNQSDEGNDAMGAGAGGGYGTSKPGKMAGDDGGEGGAGATGITAGNISGGANLSRVGSAQGDPENSYTGTGNASGGNAGAGRTNHTNTLTGFTKVYEDPFERTFLTAPSERPGPYYEVIRQNVSTMNAQDISPLMQTLLSWDTASGEKKQPIFRTVPVSWCPAGGTDTYRKRITSKDVQDAIHAQVVKSQKDFAYETALGHRRKLATVKLADKKCAIMLSSGNARMSQYSLDLIKAQRARNVGSSIADRLAAKSGHEDDSEMVDTSFANFDDGDFDHFLEEFD